MEKHTPWLWPAALLGGGGAGCVMLVKVVIHTSKELNHREVQLITMHTNADYSLEKAPALTATGPHQLFCLSFHH